MSDSSYSPPQPEETSREDRSFASVETARSWLMLSGRTQIGLTAPVRATAADVVVVDLEDHVPESEKPAARQRLRTWLSAPHNEKSDGGSAWVRIDARSTAFWEPAVAALQGAPGLQGIILAKTESATEARDTVEAFAEIPVVALIESGRGLQFVDEIAASGVARLGFGTGDFRRDTRLASPSALAYPRTRIAIASAAAGVPGPIDGGTFGTDPADIRHQAEIAVEYGFTGKFALHEQQIPPLHDISVLSNYASPMSYPPGNHGQHGQHDQHDQHGQQPPQAPPPYPHQGASGGIGMYPTPPYTQQQAPQYPQHPQQGYPGVMYRPATGALPWGLGLLVLFPIPVLGALAATVAMLIAGRSARHKGPLAAANGRHAANWAITYLLLTILLVGAHVLILILIEGRGVTGFFPVGIPITLWLIVSVAHFVITVIGLFKASKNQEFRGLGLPLLR